jgi:hypothetical protein
VPESASHSFSSSFLISIIQWKMTFLRVVVCLIIAVIVGAEINLEEEPLLNAVLREQTRFNHDALKREIGAKFESRNLAQSNKASTHLRTQAKMTFPAPAKRPHQFLNIVNWDASTTEGQSCQGEPRLGWSYPLDICIFLPGWPTNYHYILKVWQITDPGFWRK